MTDINDARILSRSMTPTVADTGLGRPAAFRDAWLSDGSVRDDHISDALARNFATSQQWLSQ